MRGRFVCLDLCHPKRSVTKKWKSCWLTVTNRDIMVSNSEKEAPKFSLPYVEVLLIQQRSYDEHRAFCISLKVRSLLLSSVPKTKKTTFWFSFSSGDEVAQWYSCINQACTENHSVFTNSIVTPPILLPSNSYSQASIEEVRVSCWG